MKKYTLIVLLILSFNSSFGQRYGLSPEDGQTGFIMAGILFAAVSLITVILYIKKRKVKK